MSLVAEISFEELLIQHGQRPALSESGRCLSYAEMLMQVRQRQAILQQHQAQRIALALDNSIEWVLWDLACLFSKKVCVPVPSFFSPHQQQHVLDDAGVDLLITAPAQQVSFLGFSPVAVGIWQRKTEHKPALPSNTRKITYTSGTTGNPKGVCLDFAAQFQVASSLWQATECTASAQHLCILPLATLLENIAGVYAPLFGGGCVELYPLAQVGLQGASGFDVGILLNTLHQVRPNTLILLPQLLLALVCALEAGMTAPSSLKFIAVGGGRVSAQVLQRAHKLGLPVFEGYGLSECASVVCLNTQSANKMGTVGTPLAHAQLKLAEDGEVLVKGAHFLGYLGDESSPPVPEWLPTGDLGHFDGPFLVLHGRKKNQFITAYGRNVNPEWVESELVQQQAIAQAWVYGEALPENTAVLVPRFSPCTDEQLQAAVDAVNQTLPDYAQVHRWLRATQPFSQTNGLATANGRLKRSALIEHYRTIHPTYFV